MADTPDTAVARDGATFENLDLFNDAPARPEGVAMGYRREPGFNDEPHHTWFIKGAGGGVHIWARQAKITNRPTEWIGGVECHWSECPSDYSGWFKPDAPSQPDCWLLDGPCWHDGTSLYFSESIAPRLPHPDSDDPHRFDGLPHSYIGWQLVDWYLTRINKDHPHA